MDWSPSDLCRVLDKGGHALNLQFAPALRDRLIDLSYSNAGLLQQLALLTLDEHAISCSPLLLRTVDKGSALESASMLYAEQLNPVYQQFARRVASGIRTRKNATGIYAHAMAIIMEASDDELVKGLHARTIYERASQRQPRIQYSNLKAILEKLPEIQVDEDGRGLIVGYSPATEEVTIVDRQLLLYRRFATVKWPWEDLIQAADQQGGQLDENG